MQKIFFLIFATLINFCSACEEISIMEEAAKKAGERLIYFYENRDTLEIKNKKSKDYVTQADQESEHIIKNILKEKYPDYSILAEESDYEKNSSSFIFVIDPLDGTTNFIKGRRDFSISIGLVQKVENQINFIAGVIYAPLHNQLFKASQGNGAYLNSKKIKISKEKKLENALITVEINGELKEDSNTFHQIQDLRPYIDVLRARTGSAALDLAYVASGQHDAFISYGLCLWDVAAGIPIIKEAQGQATDLHNKEIFIDIDQTLEDPHSINIIATNGNLHKKILGKLKL